MSLTFIQARYRPKTHKLALIVAIIIAAQIVLFFITFAYGAYMVYNNPISNVVAVTNQASTGGHYLTVYGTGFLPNSQKIIWVDPQFSPDNSSLLNPSSCCQIGRVATDSSGSFYQNFTVSAATLQKISSDGQSVHSVWVIGINQSIPNSGAYSDLISFDTQQNYTTSTQSSGLILFVSLIAFEVPINFNLGVLFIILWIIYALLFAVALNGPVRSVLGAVKETAKRGLGGMFGNSLLAVFAIFPIVLWGTVLLEAFQAAGGVATGNLPPTDPLLLYTELSIAPLREEIGFRVIPIGIVAFLMVVTKGRWKDGIMALWHPSKYLKKVDSPSQYKQHLTIMYVLIAISSILFGLAHVLLGAGWGIGKISEAAGAGVALGALYFKYGLPSTILLHWTIDVALQTWSISSYLAPFSAPLLLYTAVAAIASTIALILLLVRHFKKPTPVELYPTINRL